MPADLPGNVHRPGAFDSTGPSRASHNAFREAPESLLCRGVGVKIQVAIERALKPPTSSETSKTRKYERPHRLRFWQP
jgi:hypothetical protein